MANTQNDDKYLSTTGGNMKKLQFEPLEVFVKNINLRREKHGEENKIAVDINIRATVKAALLDCLVYGLDKSFDTILFSGKEHLKTSGFNEIKFDTQFTGYIVNLNSSALDEKHARRFTNVKIGKFSATPDNEGLVDLSFQVQFNPTKEDTEYLTDGYDRELWTMECIGPAQVGMFEQPEVSAQDEEPEATEEPEAA